MEEEIGTEKEFQSLSDKSTCIRIQRGIFWMMRNASYVSHE